ncbi:MAG: transporter [Arenicellales bacterium]
MIKTYRLTLYAVLVWSALLNVSSAQELEPRRWTHVPVDSNFFGLAYVRTDGDVLFDPVLRIEESSVNIKTAIATYLRSFDLSGKTARFDVRIPYQQARWQGLLDGTPASVERQGFGDPRIRLSVNFFGAPALKGREFQAYRTSHTTNTVVGAALAVTLPLGEYKEDKLLNLGQNRFIIRPQIGAVHSRGPWSFELTGSTFFYTDNNEFWNGNKREQEPLFAMQAHVIRSFHYGVWASVSAGAAWAGQSSVNGEAKGDQKRDSLYALSAGLPVGRRSSIKIAYAKGRTHKEVGSDADNFAVAYIGTF